LPRFRPAADCMGTHDLRRARSHTASRSPNDENNRTHQDARENDKPGQGARNRADASRLVMDAADLSAISANAVPALSVFPQASPYGSTAKATPNLSIWSTTLSRSTGMSVFGITLRTT
ncbi:MAG: hypothetical protein ACRYFY_15000, partial [Janthinobacterium lividum]